MNCSGFIIEGKRHNVVEITEKDGTKRRFVNIAILASLRSYNAINGRKKRKKKGKRGKKVKNDEDGPLMTRMWKKYQPAFTTYFTHIDENHSEEMELDGETDKTKYTFGHSELVTFEILKTGKVTMISFSAFFGKPPMIMRDKRYFNYDSFVEITLDDEKFEHTVSFLLERTVEELEIVSNEENNKSGTSSYEYWFNIWGSICHNLSWPVSCCTCWKENVPAPRDFFFWGNETGKAFYCSQIICEALSRSRYMPIHDGESKVLDEETNPERLFFNVNKRENVINSRKEGWKKRTWKTDGDLEAIKESIQKQIQSSSCIKQSHNK